MFFSFGPRSLVLFSVVLLTSCTIGRPPAGSIETLSDAQKAAISRVKAQVSGLIVWSSSRVGNHDLFLMKTDGTGIKALTTGKHVDWFPRFSPDGQRVLFARSRKPTFVYERDANKLDTWDLYTVAPDGSALTKIVDNASWGTWIDSKTLLFARGQQVVRMKLQDKTEEVLVDSRKVAALG
ncbi:MAG: PD40 domain-containing protein, partial [Deltaproteobacteria bacterium]|nr:PD40 domain-containing protein [Deltaproteobacteria bacterium]